MNLSGLLPLLQRQPTFRDFLDRAAARAAPDTVIYAGLTSAARAFFVAALHQAAGRPVLLVAPRADRARALAEQLRVYLGGGAAVRVFAEPDPLPYERVPWAVETIRERLAALESLVEPPSLALRQGRDAAPILVASVRALQSMTIPPREFRAHDRILRKGQRISPTALAQFLVEAGYEPALVVDTPSTFGVRGGIVDVFPPHAAYPARLEFWGDELDSLRLYDPATQRSLERVEHVRVIPASEVLPGPARLAPSRLAWDFANCHGAALEEIQGELARLAEGARFRGIEFYLPFAYSAPASVLHYLPPDALVIAEDWQEVEASAAEGEEQAEALRQQLEAGGDLPGGVARPYFGWQEIRALADGSVRVGLGWPPDDADEPQGVGALFGPTPHYGGQLRTALDGVAQAAKGGCRVVVVSRQAHRLAALLEPYGLDAALRDEVPTPPESAVTLVQGMLEGGWALRASPDGPAEALLLTDTELFGWAKPEPRRPRPRRAPSPEAFFADVKPGDYVVHVEQGIGIFRGLVRLTVDGAEREYLQVDFQGADKLYVPIDQADRLSRYVGATDRPPPLSRLGTADWTLVKARAKRAVTSIAKELLELYSARQVVGGHAFSPDTPWQADLEAAFPYVETEDQLNAVRAVKADMERPYPMDRLICGDVGYGKTEVALRAAFKAVMDGKQVAVLVPTTVLAQQHYETFRERMRPFPVEVEMLSRFRSKREQQQVIERLATGRVDIVIGTHRLLQKDVQFKDLGLLIVDEEQRFGVAHKEWLKQKRREVDVLTLTATPIPRTLYMSLTGARDMSTIDTPPEDRLPIKTYVGEYDEALIRRAILRELNRGGQVYFVHNRVQGIHQVAQRVARLVPEATVGVGHGQMPEADLERVMLDFAAGKLDVLVCTSIIESGLDIPNANTIIINRADQFGLAQLYQLRGRVGRSTQRAYAYLLYPRHQPLSGIARKRLDTIMEASELGAGFRIAMRDLEIRGAGELLGARQHGHISAVGFDLYCRLLAQAVRELKGESPPRVLDETALYVRPLQSATQLNLPLAAYLPESYIPDEAMRLQLYRRFAGAGPLEDLNRLAQEIEDRFGPMPPEARNLLYLMRVKALATRCDVRTIGQEAEQIVVRAGWLYEAPEAELRQRLPPGARLGRGQVWIALDDAWRDTLERTLAALNEVFAVLPRQGDREAPRAVRSPTAKRGPESA